MVYWRSYFGGLGLLFLLISCCVCIKFNLYYYLHIVVINVALYAYKTGLPSDFLVQYTNAKTCLQSRSFHYSLTGNLSRFYTPDNHLTPCPMAGKRCPHHGGGCTRPQPWLSRAWQYPGGEGMEGGATPLIHWRIPACAQSNRACCERELHNTVTCHFFSPLSRQGHSRPGRSVCCL